MFVPVDTKIQIVFTNANLFIIFQQNMTSRKHVYDDHVSVNMSLTDGALCEKNKYRIIIIDKVSPLNNGCYRREFDHYIRY